MLSLLIVQSNPDLHAGKGTAMASANCFSAWVTGLDASPASAAQRDEMLEAIQSMLVQGVEDASCFPPPQPSPLHRAQRALRVDRVTSGRRAMLSFPYDVCLRVLP